MKAAKVLSSTTVCVSIKWWKLEQNQQQQVAVVLYDQLHTTIRMFKAQSSTQGRISVSQCSSLVAVWSCLFGCVDREMESCFGVLSPRPALRVCFCCGLVRRLSVLLGGVRSSDISSTGAWGDFEIPFCNLGLSSCCAGRGISCLFWSMSFFYHWVLHGVSSWWV